MRDASRSEKWGNISSTICFCCMFWCVNTWTDKSGFHLLHSRRRYVASRAVSRSLCGRGVTSEAAEPHMYNLSMFPPPPHPHISLENKFCGWIERFVTQFRPVQNLGKFALIWQRRVFCDFSWPETTPRRNIYNWCSRLLGEKSGWSNLCSWFILVPESKPRHLASLFVNSAFECNSALMWRKARH